MDLSAYFRRIGYTGSATPTLETLTAIHAGHAASIAFENLNPLLGWPVSLDVAALEQKLVAEGRGGWCFEHNALLKAVLEEIGFEVRGLGARVLWNAPAGSLGPRSHMALLVKIRGRDFFADVGFGGQTLTTPLRLEPHTEQATTLDPFRLIPHEDDLILESLIGDQWKPLYRFGLEPQYPADYEVSNFYLCQHPSSFFRKDLLAARATDTARYGLRNSELVIHRPGKPSERRTLTDPGELRQVLTEDFQIRVPDSPEIEPLLERLVTPAVPV
jgi:N-hydroxyarylamine O-acetyltransferase